MQSDRSNKDNSPEPVLCVELVKKRSIYGYTGDELTAFLKITVALPKFIAAAKRLMEKEEVDVRFPGFRYSAYESNIDFDIR